MSACSDWRDDQREKLLSAADGVVPCVRSRCSGGFFGDALLVRLFGS